MTTVNIPSSVISLGNYAFYLCSGLTLVNIPKSVKSIGVQAFYNCAGFINVDGENSDYSSIDGVLYNKQQTILIKCPTSKVLVNIPFSVTYIEDEAFANCNGLSSVLIPNSVTAIGYGSFAHCNNLSSITIPSSVNTIYSLSFYDCSGLQSIHAKSSTPINLIYSRVFLGVNTSTCRLYVPKGAINAYKSANQWKDFVSIMEEDMSNEVHPIGEFEVKCIYSMNTHSLRIVGLIDGTILELFDLSGKKIFCGVQTRDLILDTGNISFGVYVLHIKVGNEKLVRKIVI